MDEEHIEQLRRAVDADPLSTQTRGNLASALLRTGHHEQAFEHLAVTYGIGLADSFAAVRVHRLLLAVADEFARRAELTVGRTNEFTPPDPAQGPDSAPVEDVLPGAVGQFTRPTVTLADVAGLEDVKRHIDVKLVAPMRNPELAAKYGKNSSGGLLMWGPPGCGKTFVARALAGTLGVEFRAVGVDEVLDMWVGNSEKNLASLFTMARSRAPTTLFFDEADAIGGLRSRMGTHATMRSLVSVLLTELDGAVRDNSGVFVIGATNVPWDVDPALRRPGRFDRTLFVPPPDRAARIGVLANRLATVPLGRDLRLDRIAAISQGWSGADVSAIIDLAVDAAFAEALRTGREVVVDQALLERAAESTASSIADWTEVAMVAAEASSDVELYSPFLQWLARRDRDR